MKSFH